VRKMNDYIIAAIEFQLGISRSARENGNAVDDGTSLCITHSPTKPVEVIISVVYVQT
jgi:hypothetical protein